MRRSGHPSRPRAMTCCFFASLKTYLISTKATALRRNQRPRASSSLAGFEVTLIGRFWVTPEVQRLLGDSAEWMGSARLAPGDHAISPSRLGRAGRKTDGQLGRLHCSASDPVDHQWLAGSSVKSAS